MSSAPASNLTLYGYFRSSAAYRVRIALNLKGLAAHDIPVHLTRGGGEQLQPEFTRINPMQAVPVLVDGNLQLSQSLAIIEYLDERYPDVPLLPADLGLRAQARMLALTIACDIHPVNNLRIVNYLTAHFGMDAAGRQAWMQHWIEAGFGALEAQLAESSATGRFCVGDTPTLADCCLVPQVFNARRFAVDIARYPNIDRITAECERLPAFERAHPARQADAE